MMMTFMNCGQKCGIKSFIKCKKIFNTCISQFNCSNFNFTFPHKTLLENELKLLNIIPSSPCLCQVFNTSSRPFSTSTIINNNLQKTSYDTVRRKNTIALDNDSSSSLLYSATVHEAILKELNTASDVVLESYGFKPSSVVALVYCRPLQNLLQLRDITGANIKAINRYIQKVHETMQNKTQTVRPVPDPLVVQGMQTVVSLVVLRGRLAYAHLTLPVAGSDEVHLLKTDLLCVEMRDPKLHPIKLHMQTVQAVQQLPPACCHALLCFAPPRVAASDTAVEVQRAQVFGLVQGLLARDTSLRGSVLFHVRENFIHSLFGLKHGPEPTACLKQLDRVVRGGAATSAAVPRLRTSGETLRLLTDHDTSTLFSLAPALYTGLALCTAVATHAV